MRAVACVGVAIIACAMTLPAKADNLAASIEAGTERTPEDFSHPLLNYDNVTLIDNYDSGFGWALFAQNSRLAHGGNTAWLFEGMVGYRFVFSPVISVYASAGAGERLTAARDFPYLTARGGIDAALTTRLTWNAVNLRYREGLDSDVAYRGYNAGSGFTYRVNDEGAVFTRVFAAFDTEGRFAGTGFGIGLRRYF